MSTLTGTDGDDRINGSGSADTITGGAGADTITGSFGADSIDAGAGDDQIVWGTFDAGDTVEGGAGVDTLVLNSFVGVSDTFNLFASLGRAVMPAGSSYLRITGIERIDIHAGDGTDYVVIDNLGSTAVRTVNVDLGNSSGAPNGQVNTVTLTGAASADTITVAQVSGGHGIVVTDTADGVTETTRVTALDTSDVVGIDGGDGDDHIFVGAGSSVARIAVNGGDGADAIVGSSGADTLGGGAGADTITGGFGADSIDGGDGDDRIAWSTFDSPDTVEGGAGADTLVLNSATGVSDVFHLFAWGGQVLTPAGAGNLHVTGVETVDIHTGDGTDYVLIDDLSTTDVRTVDVDLGAASAGGRTVELGGGSGDDAVQAATTANGALAVSGLSADVVLSGLKAGDTLHVLGAGGDDVLDLSGVPLGATLVLEGGDGSDTLTGNGETRFQFGAGESGQDVVTAFHAHQGGAGGDVIVLNGFADQSFDDLVANGHLVQSGDAVLVLDGSDVVVTLQNVSVSDLTSADFLFG